MRMLAVALSVMTALATTSAAVRADETKVIQPKKVAIAFVHLQGVNADVGSFLANPIVSGVLCLPKQELMHLPPGFQPGDPSGVAFGPPAPSGWFGFSEWHSPQPHGACDARGFTAYRPVVQFDLSALRGRTIRRAMLIGVSPNLYARPASRTCAIGDAVEATGPWPGQNRWVFFKPFPAAVPQYTYDKAIPPVGPSVAQWDVTNREQELVRDGKIERSYMIRGTDATEKYFEAPDASTTCVWRFSNFHMEFTLVS